MEKGFIFSIMHKILQFFYIPLVVLVWIFLPIQIGIPLSDQSLIIGPHIPELYSFVPLSLLIAIIIVLSRFLSKNRVQIPSQALVATLVFLIAITIPYLLSPTKDQVLYQGILWTMSFFLLLSGNKFLIFPKKFPEFLALIILLQLALSFLQPGLINTSVLALMGLFLALRILYTKRPFFRQILLSIVALSAILFAQFYPFILLSLAILILHKFWLPRTKKFQKYHGFIIIIILAFIGLILNFFFSLIPAQWGNYSLNFAPHWYQYFIGVGAGEYHLEWSRNAPDFLTSSTQLIDAQYQITLWRIFIEIGLLGLISFLFFILMSIPKKERPDGALWTIFIGITTLPLLFTTPNGILILTLLATLRKKQWVQQMQLPLEK